MEINVKLIKNYYKKIKKFNEDYEINYLNFYNELNHALNNWQDDNSKRFNEQITTENNAYKKIILDLKQLENDLKIISEKYETIGDHINYIKENKNSLYSLFDQYLNKISNTISFINSLDLSFCPELQNNISNIKSNLVDSQNKIKTIKSKTKNIINSIDQKEDEINRLLSKFEYKTINEMFYKNYE